MGISLCVDKGDAEPRVIKVSDYPLGFLKKSASTAKGDIPSLDNLPPQTVNESLVTVEACWIPKAKQDGPEKKMIPQEEKKNLSWNWKGDASKALAIPKARNRTSKKGYETPSESSFLGSVSPMPPATPLDLGLPPAESGLPLSSDVAPGVIKASRKRKKKESNNYCSENEELITNIPLIVEEEKPESQLESAQPSVDEETQIVHGVNQSDQKENSDAEAQSVA